MSAICRACFQKIRLISRVTHCLYFKAATMLANALESRKLHYCNASDITNKILHRLQLGQEALYRIVCKLPWRSHVSYHMKSLNWLPIKFGIDFKTCVILYKTVSMTALTTYLNFLHPVCCKHTSQPLFENTPNHFLQ